VYTKGLDMSTKQTPCFKHARVKIKFRCRFKITGSWK